MRGCGEQEGDRWSVLLDGVLLDGRNQRISVKEANLDAHLD
jgi:hypothetical protein